MSFYTFYQAIPERSRLLDRLRSERTFCGLYTWLIPYGPGPLHFEQLDPDELDSILDDFTRNGLFGSREDVDRCLKDLAAELAEATRDFPGLQKRAAYIEKQHREIEGPLARELSVRGFPAAVALMKELLYGGDPLAPEFVTRDGPQLGLIAAPTVAAGAQVLAGVELSEETHGLSDYACEQFREWKSLILEAARRGEAVLVLATG